MIGEFGRYFDSYSFSIVGRSHYAKGIKCQDKHLSLHLGGDWHLSAVADGLGSAPCSGVGAAEILDAFGEYCGLVFSSASDENFLELLSKGFQAAYNRLLKISNKNHRSMSDYATTLTACLYNGERVLIGHVGDGGVIGMDEGCRYHLLTKAQKGEAWNEVCPFTNGRNNWQFYEVPQSYRAILLLTDGLLDVASPSLLFGQEELLYRRFVSFFLPPDLIGKQCIIARSELAREEILWLENSNSQYADFFEGEFTSGNNLGKRLTKLLSSESYDYLTDDLTAVAIWKLNATLSPTPEGYLDSPDWGALRRERYNKLYPRLKQKEDISNDFK